jgi:hypothetical protein
MAATPFTIGVRRRLPWGGASALAVIAALLSVTGVGVAATDSDAALRRHQAPLLDPQAPDGRRAQPPADHEHHHALAATALATTAPLAPKRGGSWEYGTPFENRFNAVHTVAGAGGKILEIAGSGNSSDEFEAGSFRTFLWDTVTDTRREIATPDDMFCAGHVLLPDGRALVGGGTTAYSPFKGSRRLYAFDFVQERYERLTDMEVGRWYPSLVTDWLGRTLIVGGLDENGINTQVTERFDYRTDTLTRLASTRRFSLYPQIHLASRKRMFVAERSDGQEPGFWDPSAAKRFVPVRGHTDGGRRGGAASCFIGDVRDQRLMIMGGGWPATDSTNVIDLDAASPAYKPGPSLHEPKAYVSCVNLPTGGLLEAHGGTANQVDAASSEVARLNATGTGWVPLNPLPDGEHRLYPLDVVPARQRAGGQPDVQSQGRGVEHHPADVQAAVPLQGAASGDHPCTRQRRARRNLPRGRHDPGLDAHARHLDGASVADPLRGAEPAVCVDGRHRRPLHHPRVIVDPASGKVPVVGGQRGGCSIGCPVDHPVLSAERSSACPLG